MSDESNTDQGSGNGQGSSGQGSSGPGDANANWLEWTMTVLGGLIVLSSLSYLVYALLAGAGGAPAIRVSLGAPQPDSTIVLVPLEVRNDGGTVAANVVTEVCAGSDNCGQITFLYVPHEAVRQGRVGLSAPLDTALTARVVSFSTP